MLLASTGEGLENADTWKVLTKIQMTKSNLQLAATNCVYIYGSAFQSKIGYALLMRTITMYLKLHSVTYGSTNKTDTDVYIGRSEWTQNNNNSKPVMPRPRGGWTIFFKAS